MDLYLSLLPGDFTVIGPVLYTLSLRVHSTARWHLRACLNACLIVCLGACLGDCLNDYLREPRFGRSSVFHGKLLADGKL